MAEPNERRTDGAPPREIHIERKGVNWLAWILLAAGLLALLLGLARCNRHDDVAVVPAATPTATATAGQVIGATAGADSSTVLAGVSGLGGYLAGTDAAPRRFTFERLNFDTASSTIRAQDNAEVAAVATTLGQYPNARVRIAGYADARGSSAANTALGNARAQSVKAALVAHGVQAARIATGSGGEGDPVDSNATTSGQAENRRTELVVTAR